MRKAGQVRAPEAGFSEKSAVRGAGRGALAIVMIAGALSLASAPARADDTAKVSERIAAGLDLATQDTALQALLARRAAVRRSLQKGITVAALPYVGMATRLSDLPPFPGSDQTRMLDVPPPHHGVIVEARLPRPRPQDAPIITGSIGPSSPVPSASEAEYLHRFTGSFVGSGRVQRNANESPHDVTCNLTGRSTASDVSISGKCSVFIISRDIRADIHYDPATGSYSGTYIGSKVGPARLWGKRHGDSVVLAIKWPRPVNGDTNATMTIRNSGNGKLAIIVTDQLRPGGPTADVTQIALAR